MARTVAICTISPVAVRAARLPVQRPAHLAAPSHKRGSRRVAQPVIKAFAGETAADASVTLSFAINKQVNFGQEVLLVGSVKALGDWDLATAVPLTWEEGHRWTASVAMPAGEEVQFKFVVANPNLGQPLWESGANRTLVVDAAAPLLTASWEQPLQAQAATVAAALEAEPTPEEPAAADEPAPEEEPVAQEAVSVAAAEAAEPQPEPKQPGATRKIKMSPEAEAAVNGIIARAEAAAAKVAGAVAELSASEAVGAASGAVVKGKAAQDRGTRRQQKRNAGKKQ